MMPASSAVVIVFVLVVLRVDMLVGEFGQPYVIEINTLPGLIELSDLPAQAKAAGISYDQLIDQILTDAEKIDH